METKAYSITCRETGMDMGVYLGEDAYGAAKAFYADAGYSDMNSAAETLGYDSADEMLDGLRIVEVA